MAEPSGHAVAPTSGQPEPASEHPPAPPATHGERGRLYIVATPIGNLGDITLRALEVLRTVRLVAAEDTRHSGNLLRHFGIATRLISYHAHNRVSRQPRILEELGQGDVALISDAGTPVISDPGQELVHAAAAAGHHVIPIPGPSAPIAAAAVSGIAAPFVHFAGFLPRRSSERRRALALIAAWPGAVTFFEAPHRLLASLRDVLAVAGDRELAVCCELTKLYEHVYRGSVSGALAYYESVRPRGEFTIVLRGAEETAADAVGHRDLPLSAAAGDDLTDRFEALQRQHGDRKRALSALAAETRVPRKVLYARFMARPGGPER